MRHDPPLAPQVPAGLVAVMSDITGHLPADLRKGIEKYERDITSGELTFDGEFAHKPGTTPDVEMEFFASKLPGMDITHVTPQ